MSAKATGRPRAIKASSEPTNTNSFSPLLLGGYHERDWLARLQTFVTAAGDVREVGKNICTASIWCYEAEALVEHFHDATMSNLRSDDFAGLRSLRIRVDCEINLFALDQDLLCHVSDMREVGEASR